MFLLWNSGESESLGKVLKFLKREHCDALQRHLQLGVKNVECWRGSPVI